MDMINSVHCRESGSDHECEIHYDDGEMREIRLDAVEIDGSVVEEVALDTEFEYPNKVWMRGSQDCEFQRGSHGMILSCSRDRRSP